MFTIHSGQRFTVECGDQVDWDTVPVLSISMGRDWLRNPEDSNADARLADAIGMQNFVVTGHLGGQARVGDCLLLETASGASDERALHWSVSGVYVLGPRLVELSGTMQLNIRDSPFLGAPLAVKGHGRSNDPRQKVPVFVNHRGVSLAEEDRLYWEAIDPPNSRRRLTIIPLHTEQERHRFYGSDCNQALHRGLRSCALLSSYFSVEGTLSCGSPTDSLSGRVVTDKIVSELVGAGLRSLSFGIAHQFHEFKEMGISKQTTAKAMREYADGAQRLRDFVSSQTGVRVVYSIAGDVYSIAGDGRADALAAFDALALKHTPILPGVRSQLLQNELLDGTRSGRSSSPAPPSKAAATKTPPEARSGLRSTRTPQVRAQRQTAGDEEPPSREPGTLAGHLGWDKGGNRDETPRRQRRTNLETKATPTKPKKSGSHKKQRGGGGDGGGDSGGGGGGDGDGGGGNAFANAAAAAKTAAVGGKVGLSDLTPAAIEQLRASLKSEQTGSEALIKEVTAEVTSVMRTEFNTVLGIVRASASEVGSALKEEIRVLQRDNSRLQELVSSHKSEAILVAQLQDKVKMSNRHINAARMQANQWMAKSESKAIEPMPLLEEPGM